jgi:hypothetical protein
MHGYDTTAMKLTDCFSLQQKDIIVSRHELVPGVLMLLRGTTYPNPLGPDHQLRPNAPLQQSHQICPLRFPAAMYRRLKNSTGYVGSFGRGCCSSSLSTVCHMWLGAFACMKVSCTVRQKCAYSERARPMPQSPRRRCPEIFQASECLTLTVYGPGSLASWLQLYCSEPDRSHWRLGRLTTRISSRRKDLVHHPFEVENELDHPPLPHRERWRSS